MDKKNCVVEVFSRVTGFFRPVQSWNNGKIEEFKDRERFDLEKWKGSNKNCDVCSGV